MVLEGFKFVMFTLVNVSLLYGGEGDQLQGDSSASNSCSLHSFGPSFTNKGRAMYVVHYFIKKWDEIGCEYSNLSVFGLSLSSLQVKHKLQVLLNSHASSKNVIRNRNSTFLHS